MFDLYANYREMEIRARAQVTEQRNQAEALRRIDRMERKVSAIRGRLSLSLSPSAPARPDAA